MSAKLYEPCEFGCEDGRIRGVNQMGMLVSAECACKGTKFIEIGLTVNQLERLTTKADGLDRIARLVRRIDLVELGIVADRLRNHGYRDGSEFVRLVQETLGACLVLTDVNRSLGRKEPAHAAIDRD